MSEAQVPIHDRAAERVLVATAALDPGCIAEIQALVRPEDCYRTENQEILAACYALADAGRDVESAAVLGWLGDHGRLAHAGGADGVSSLFASGETTVDPSSVARRVAVLAAVRRTDEVMRRKAAEARGPLDDAETWLREAPAEVQRVADDGLRSRADSLRGVRDVAAEFLSRVTATIGPEDREERISTGLASLDAQIGKLARKSVHVFAARPGVGKTALAQQCVVSAARRGVRCLVLSLEMAASDLLSRSVAWIAGVNHAILELREIDPTGAMYQDVLGAVDEVAKLPIVYDDNSRVTMGGIRGAVRRASRMLGGPVDLLVIDYLQLVKTAERRGASRTELLGEVSHGVLAIAKDFDLAVIEVSQLNRPDKRAKPMPPKLEDIRECGDIEQDARVVVGLHREDMGAAVGPVDLHVLKCRQGGRVGRVSLAWNGPTMSFADTDAGAEPLGRSWQPRNDRPVPRPYHEPVERDDPGAGLFDDMLRGP